MRCAYWHCREYGTADRTVECQGQLKLVVRVCPGHARALDTGHEIHLAFTATHLTAPHRSAAR